MSLNLSGSIRSYLFVNSSFSQPCLARGFFDQDCIKSDIVS
ncbi:hypothetical protein VP191E371_P0090 [Vibrio phage 191E37-1]|nr:hypothetical protein VP191E371_P0090 [Vibrio phage 191E37-1]CAH9016486.1 hypothetical protein VP511E551_P0095 [Vibrio phage 511E55-1]